MVNDSCIGMCRVSWAGGCGRGGNDQCWETSLE